MSHEIKYRKDIDGLRAIAVLLVVFYHAFPSRLTGGFIGVDIFFVISGYLISTIILKQLNEQRFSFKIFYIKRINRIFPTLILVLFSCFILGWVTLFAEELKQLNKHIMAGAIFSSNFVLWLENGYFDSVAELKPLLHLWSLSVEEQFYIVWPLLLFISFKRNLNILLTIGIIITSSFIFNIFYITNNAVATFYLLPTRFWELLIGGYLASITFYQNKLFLKFQSSEECMNFFSIVGLIFIFISAFFINGDNLYPGYLALLPTVGSFLLIYSGPNAWINRKILSHSSLVFIGLISYPLYLWHWPILSFLRIVNYGEMASVPVRGIALIISFLLSWLTYKFIEKPLKTFQNPSKISLILIATLLLVGLVSFQTYQISPERKNLKIGQMIDNQEYLKNEVMVKDCPAVIDSKLMTYCLLSRKNIDPSVILIGDSHANALFSGLSESLIEDNVLNLGHSGCLPFFNTESAQIGEKDLCVKEINKALNYAINNDSIKTIILASRGALYVTGKGYNEPKYNHYIKNLNIPTVEKFESIFRYSLTDTLTHLEKSKKKIIVVLDNPELGFYSSICLEPRVFSTIKKQKKSCNIRYQDYKNRSDSYTKIVKEVLKKFPQVNLFNQSKYLCDKKYCHAVIDGKILYKDDDHLSYFGSKFMAERFLLEFPDLK